MFKDLFKISHKPDTVYICNCTCPGLTEHISMKLRKIIFNIFRCKYTNLFGVLEKLIPIRPGLPASFIAVGLVRSDETKVIMNHASEFLTELFFVLDEGYSPILFQNELAPYSVSMVGKTTLYSFIVYSHIYIR